MKYMRSKRRNGTAIGSLSNWSQRASFDLDEIPAWVCSQCGEVYFEEPEVDAIQEVIPSLDKENQKTPTSCLISHQIFLALGCWTDNLEQEAFVSLRGEKTLTGPHEVYAEEREAAAELRSY